MIYRKYHDTKLSTLGLGNMRLPVKKNATGEQIDREKAQEIIEYAIRNGVNYFDTAYIYHNGESEDFLGSVLAKYSRSDYYLATKFLLQANPEFEFVFREQLRRLKTEYVDFYLIHAISDQTVSRYLEGGCLKYFDEQKRVGKIRHLGFSFHGSIDTLKQTIAARDWDFAQIQLNYYDWAYDIAKEEYEILAQRNIPIMVMEPMRGGRLATLPAEAEQMLKKAHPDWTIASWAFRWLMGLPKIQVVLSGMSTMDQLKENIDLFSSESALTSDDEEILFRACELFRREVHIPCTACRYCCDDCPSKIDIPTYLDYMNRYLISGRWGLHGIDKVASKGSPKECIACGTCTEHYPQNIQISDYLQRLASLI